MAFAARNEQGWRLCLRKGRTIYGTKALNGEWEEFLFPNQPKAKACADELNEKFWPEFEKHEKSKKALTFPRAQEMVETIRRHL